MRCKAQAQLPRVGPDRLAVFRRRGGVAGGGLVDHAPAPSSEYHRRYRGWLARGVYLPPSAYEVCFLSAAHTTADVDKLLDVLATSDQDGPVMRPDFRQWFAERAELIVLGVTLLATASLVFWWTILLRGEMRNNEALERALLEHAARTHDAAGRRAPDRKSPRITIGATSCWSANPRCWR